MPGRRRSAGRGRRVRARRFVTSTRVFGSRIRTPFDPPVIVDKPWNSVTVQLGGAGDASVTPASLGKVANKQLGLLEAQTLEFRLLKVRVWALSTSRPLRCSFFGYGDFEVGLQVMEDWGTPTRFPHVGYLYPASVQLYDYKSTATTTTSLLFKVDVGTTSSGSPIPWLAYCDILWRSDVYNPITLSERYRIMQMSQTDDPEIDFC